ncbi:MAG TPA: ABC transporter permease [Thermoanaerobaculia bacterium]|nr:ABC transporter permease [Thermoanaerobaculia bacterium]
MNRSDRSRSGWGEEIARNLRLAARLLARSPAFTLAAVLTLGLCIGANTAIFSVVDAALLRPLPYPHPERLAQMVIRTREKGREDVETGQDGAVWETVSRQSRALDCAVNGDTSGVNLAAGDKPEYVKQQRVSAGFFRVLGIHPALGRELSGDEDRPGGPAVAVLSHALWRRAFAADPQVIGRAIRLKGEPYTVVGVLPATFQSSVRADLWTPLRPSTTGEGEGTNYEIIARLRPGASWVQANSELAALSGTALAHFRYPPSVLGRLAILPLQRGQTLSLRAPLLLLWAAVSLVLLIGCLNVAGLLLARSAGRSREMATRVALGGGRAALVRQLLVESLVLALLGGAAGLAFGALAMKALSLLARDSLTLPQEIRLDARVAAMAMAITLLTTLLFGLLPALRASAVDPHAELIERAGTGARGEQRWPRRLLVVGEVALGVVLLIGAGLLIRTLGHFEEIPKGFDSTNVITATLSLDDARYVSTARMDRLFSASLERIRQLPGVETAAVGLSLPYERWLNMGFRVAGPHSTDKMETTDLLYITPDYFQALRIPQLRGRSFTTADRTGSARVAIVTRSFVQKYLRDQEPLGSRLKFGDQNSDQPWQIVGVVGDVARGSGWGQAGPLATLPAAFIPAAQVPDSTLALIHTWFSPSWVVRTRGPQRGVAAGIARAIQTIDPELPIARFRDLDEVAAGRLAWQRFQTTLLTTLAGLALLLAAVGIYGLIASAVAERRRELGIRMALGATVAQAMRTVALPGVLLVAGGVAVGSALAYLTVQTMQQVIWGVKPTDPATFLSVAAIFLLVAAAASFLPALRIARLDPARTLRSE